MRARMRSRPLAVALILLTVLGSMGSWHAGDDPDAGATVAAHDHAAHDARLRDEPSQPAPEHCALCHWLQAFRAATPRHTRLHTETLAALPRPAAVRHPRLAVALVDLPSRAPPA